MLRLVIICLFLIIACVQELLHDEPAWRALALAAPVAMIVLAGIHQYRALKRAVQKYDGTLAEFQFADNLFAISRNGKRLELSWKEFKKVWVSKNILMLITCLNEKILLPVTGLNPEQKSFMLEKLASLNLLSRRQQRILGLPAPVKAPK